MSAITNEFMMEMLGKSKNYSIVILKKGPNENISERQQIVWEHAAEILNYVKPGCFQLFVLWLKKMKFAA